jgi:hypothetical protein
MKTWIAALVGLLVGVVGGHIIGPLNSVPAGFTALSQVQISNPSNSTHWPCPTTTPCSLPITADFQFATSKPASSTSCGTDSDCFAFTDFDDTSPTVVATTVGAAPCWKKQTPLYISGTVSFASSAASKNLKP